MFISCLLISLLVFVGTRNIAVIDASTNNEQPNLNLGNALNEGQCFSFALDTISR